MRVRTSRKSNSCPARRQLFASVVMLVIPLCVLDACGVPTETEESSIETAQLRANLSAEESMFEKLSRALGKGRAASRVNAGQARLCSLQADIIGDGAGNGLVDADPDDGGWDFTSPSNASEHSPDPSPENTYGLTALALLIEDQQPSAFDASVGCALDAALGMQMRSGVDSGPDFVFWTLLDQRTTNHGFGAQAIARYEARLAEHGGVEGLGAYLRDLRHNSNNDGLIAYDLGWLVLAAQALDTVDPGRGFDEDATTYAQLVVDDLTSAEPRFDIDDSSEGYYATGLSWSLVSLRQLGAERQLWRRVFQQLRVQQADDGGFRYNGDESAADLQTTAHAAFTLTLTMPHRTRVWRRAGRWLAEAQASNGGWEYFPGLESTLVDSEALLALALTGSNLRRARLPGSSTPAPRALLLGEGPGGRLPLAPAP